MTEHEDLRELEVRKGDLIPLKDKEESVSKSFREQEEYQKFLNDWRKILALFRSYPDLFIDFILPEDSKFKLTFYQRLMMRVIIRYRRTFLTYTRGTAKSFTQILTKIVECILYPNLEIMLTAPHKKMASEIAQSNIESIFKFIPLLESEVKEKKFEKDYTRLKFYNGSFLDVVGNSESSRGQRRSGLSVEEIIHERFSEEDFNTVILPIMANNRFSANGGEDPYELHKRITIVTTAGTKQSFGYSMMMEYLEDMEEGKSAYVMGSSYELATGFGMLSIDYVNELKNSPNFNPISFMREYESIWSGSSENSLIDLEKFRESRILKKAEDRAVADKNVEYVLTYDVARSEGNMNAQSALVVIKITPRGDGTYSKHVVNIYSFEGSHFKKQAQFLKQKVNDFRARVLIVDANGLGKGLVDNLVMEIDDNPPYEVINDSRYEKFKTSNSIPILFAMNSSNADTKSSDIHTLFMSWVGNNQVKFLQGESVMRSHYSKVKDSEELAKKIRPYVATDLLQEEIMNLQYRASGNNITVRQISKKIQKDRFSALEYGLYWIYLTEQKEKAELDREVVGDFADFFVSKKPKFLY